VKPPDATTFVLRHFDPVLMQIKYGPDAFPLKPLIQEVNNLSLCVAAAFKRLQIAQANVY